MRGPAHLTTDVAPVLVGGWGVAGIAVLASGDGALAWLLAGVLVGVAAAVGPLVEVVARS